MAPKFEYVTFNVILATHLSGGLWCLATPTINLPTGSNFKSISPRYEDTKCDVKCTKWGDLR